jgi:hypothetical protein
MPRTINIKATLRLLPSADDDVGVNAIHWSNDQNLWMSLGEAA